MKVQKLNKENFRFALILVYFGRFPEWIDLCFASCVRQSSVDWIVFTDAEVPSYARKYKNVRFQQFSIDEFRLRAVEVFGSCIAKSFHPKKICDYRPAFGHLFAKELAGYDFWGHFDHDMVFGDVQSRLLPHCLEADIVSTHGYRVAGPLTLYRNNSAINGLWTRIPNYGQLLSDSAVQHFCEEEHYSIVVRNAYASGEIRAVYAPFPTAHDGMRQSFVLSKTRLIRKQLPCDAIPQVIRRGLTRFGWKHPLLQLVPREFLYFHFRLWKEFLTKPMFDPFASSTWTIDPMTRITDSDAVY